MGALKGSITVRRYVARGRAPRDRERIVKGVRAHVLMPIDPKGDVDRSHGWACLRDAQDTDLTSEKIFFGSAVALSMRVDVLKAPAALVRQLVEKKLAELGRKPSRGEKRAAKAEVVRKLRGELYPVVKAFDLVWEPDEGKVLFWSQGKTPNELLVDLFGKSFGLELVPDGPGVRSKAIPAIDPTPEMVVGFPGAPGRIGDETVEEAPDACDA